MPAWGGSLQLRASPGPRGQRLTSSEGCTSQPAAEEAQGPSLAIKKARFLCKILSYSRRQHAAVLLPGEDRKLLLSWLSFIIKLLFFPEKVKPRCRGTQAPGCSTESRKPTAGTSHMQKQLKRDGQAGGFTWKPAAILSLPSRQASKTLSSYLLCLHLSLSRHLSLQGHTKSWDGSGELLVSGAEGPVPGAVQGASSSHSLWWGKTGNLRLASDAQQKLLHIDADMGKTCMGCVSVGGSNNLWMTEASRMPAGSRRHLEGSTHPWPVGTGVRHRRRSGQGCGHVPPAVPCKQILMHREHYQANSQVAKKTPNKTKNQTQTKTPKHLFSKRLQTAWRKHSFSWQQLSQCKVATKKARWHLSGEKVPQQEQTVGRSCACWCPPCGVGKHTVPHFQRGKTQNKKNPTQIPPPPPPPNHFNPARHSATWILQLKAQSQHSFPFGSVWTTEREAGRRPPGPQPRSRSGPRAEARQLLEGWASGCVPCSVKRRLHATSFPGGTAFAC